jgi:hypothetical protein
MEDGMRGIVVNIVDKHGVPVVISDVIRERDEDGREKITFIVEPPQGGMPVGEFPALLSNDYVIPKDCVRFDKEKALRIAVYKDVQENGPLKEMIIKIVADDIKRNGVLKRLLQHGRK